MKAGIVYDIIIINNKKATKERTMMLFKKNKNEKNMHMIQPCIL